MKNLVNEAVIELINCGLIPLGRLNSLIYIKELIDRISTKKYIDDETAESLREKYGVLPNIITWGDYFQTEMASSLMTASDAEFEKAVATVKFDMMASQVIFSDKGPAFFEWVKNGFEAIEGRGYEELNEEEKEIAHLNVLMNYFGNLGIEDLFTEAELKWFNFYSDAIAV